MKVIADNRPENRFSFPIRVTCIRCKSILEAEKADVKKEQPDPRDQGGGDYYYVSCPLCLANNPVKPSPIKVNTN